MNTTQLAVEMTVYAKENKSIWNITKDKPYKLLEPRNNFYKGAVFGFIDDLGLERIIGIKLLNKYFTTTPPDQKIKQQALAQCDEALKLNSQIGNFGKPNDKDNKPDQEGGSSGLLNGFNDGLHRSSGIGGQSPELSTLDQEGKREEPYHEIIDSTEELISQLQSRVKELEGLNEAAEKHIEIITRERDWQTDVVVPDLDQQIAALKQENERLKGEPIMFADYFHSLTPTQRVTVHPPAGSGMGTGIYPLTTLQIYDKWKSPTAPTTDEQTDK